MREETNAKLQDETIASESSARDAAGEINPRLAAITEAIQAATNQIDAFKEQQKRGEVKRQDEGGDDEEVCDAQCLTERVLEVVYEIVSTIREIIQNFGLGRSSLNFVAFYCFKEDQFTNAQVKQVTSSARSTRCCLR